MAIFPEKYEAPRSGPPDPGDNDGEKVDNIVDFMRKKRLLSHDETGGPEGPEDQIKIDLDAVAKVYDTVSANRRQNVASSSQEIAYDDREKELTRLSQSIIDANWGLEETYSPVHQSDQAGFQLQQGLLAIAGLAHSPTHDPVEYARWVVDHHDRLQGPDGPLGSDYRRRQCMRLFDSLETLELAYDGMYMTDDETADKERFLEFVGQFCQTKAFEKLASAQHVFNGVRDSYKILILLAGPEAKKHGELVEIIEKLKQELLTKGVEINESVGREADNARTLAWTSWPEV